MMRNENLRKVCLDLGLDSVATVISTGNIVFEADSGDRKELESVLEAAWLDVLGFQSTTILRSKDELETIVKMEPFGDLEHGGDTYLLATFSKRPLTMSSPLPWRPTDQAFEVVGATESEVFTVADTTAPRTPDVMSWLEREHGKDITSRTWLTVHRILRKMGPARNSG